jgi:tetratricopeptide (TPR) repeat protein
MEYLPGGSLAEQLRGDPMAPRQAAALVEAVTQGVQHAHDYGIIHRDLKPGNILLEGAGVDSPRVSDFGTAKRPESSGLSTPTQAILGTPSYMAPEQALGRSRDVGPQADIYALGAILYELLTGRPPFRGATPYETLLQSVSHDPTSPRRILADVPRDLESVCLKCLEKEAAGRYPTAEALSVDLRAFLEGRAVTCRPLSWTDRMARRARREPAVAALSALSLTLLIAGLIVATTLWLRAEARAREAAGRLRLTAEALRLYTQAANSLFRQPELVSQEEREALIRALEMYERLQSDVSGNADEEHRIAFATLQLANGLHNLKRYDVATRVSGRAVEALRRLSLAHPSRDDFRHTYAEGCSQLGGSLAAAGELAEAMSFRREAVRVGQQLVDRDPTRDAYRASLAAYWSWLAKAYVEHGDTASARPLLVRSLRVNRELIARYRGDPFRYVHFASVSMQFIEFLVQHERTNPEICDLVRERIDMCERARGEDDWPLIAAHLLSFDLALFLDRAGMRTEADRTIAYGLSVWQELKARTPPSSGAAAGYALWLESKQNRERAANPTAAKR